VESPPGRLLVARVTLRLSRRDLIEAKSSWNHGRDCNLDCRRRRECELVSKAIVRRVREQFALASVRSAGAECVAAVNGGDLRRPKWRCVEEEPNQNLRLGVFFLEREHLHKYVVDQTRTFH
jgi:hypothetical protein